MTASCLNGDCLKLMRDLSDNSIDLFMCDLPYGCINGKNIKWDNPIDLDAFWIQVKRLCKNEHTPVIMFCNTKFGNDLINSNKEWFRYDIVWKKSSSCGFLNANIQPLRNHEMIYVFSKKKPFYKRIDEYVEGAKEIIRTQAHVGGIYGLKERAGVSRENYRCAKSVIEFKKTQSKLHPTCKCIDLYKWLIERYSNEGDMVLDPTAGSFNSGRASIELNRNYIGMEMNNEYFEKNKL
jgi:site-specific DNA-methyltransferase (adenine-specific)